MTCRRKQVNVDRDAWNQIKQMIGGNTLSDTKRSRIIKDVLQEVDIKSKLQPEFADSSRDRIIKKTLRGMI